MTPFWQQIQGDTLAQGDLLPDCPVPMFPVAFGGAAGEYTVRVELGNMMVVTQSCDLANGKAPVVALCPVWALADYMTADPTFKNWKAWENVRKGRVEGLHLLASPDDPTDNKRAVVVDFRQIFSLPFDYLQAHAKTVGPRWRLASPFLEHFSQAFARFFMRVGLPAAIPEYK